VSIAWLPALDVTVTERPSESVTVRLTLSSSTKPLSVLPVSPHISVKLKFGFVPVWVNAFSLG
jgi:hypothetical protein